MVFAPLLAAALLGFAPAPATTPAKPTLPATPQFRRYGIDQGLPSSNVYTIVQDRRGMVWMGTRNGLVRYDGSTFKIFQRIPGKPDSLTGNDVSSVLTDSRGRVWASGDNGLNLFNRLHKTFQRFQHDDKNPGSLASNSVMALAEGKHGSLWIGMFGAGLDHMTSLGHFEHLRHQDGHADSLVSDNILSLFSRGKGRLWIGTDQGLDIRQADGTIQHVRFVGLDKSPGIWRIEGDAKQVRVDTTHGLFVVGKDGLARPIAVGKLGSHTVMTSVRDRHGALWVGTLNGLYLLEPDGRTTYFQARPLLPGGQPGNLIWQLMLDHEGGLWIATQNAGVVYLSPDWRDFSHYAHRPDDPSSLSGSRILALAPDGHGGLWVGGTNSQLDKLDPLTGQVQHHADQLGLGALSVTALASAGKYGLWVGSHNSLGLFDGHHLHPVDAPWIRHGARWMVSDADGTAYAAPPGRGIYRIDPVTLQATALEQAWPGEAGRETRDLLMHKGVLWRASRAGLTRLDSDQLHLRPVPGVARGMVHALAFSGDNLWLARAHALEHYLVHGGKATLVRRIDTSSGWPGIEIITMAVDHNGRLWLFAGTGLWLYNPATQKFRRFGKQDGLPSPEFTSRQWVYLPNGTLFAGTLRGVIGFDPDHERDHPRAPKLILTSARVHRDGHDVELPLNDHRLHLRWDDRDLRITVQALSYINPARNRYRFHLQGFDTEWVDTGTRHLREFAGLGSGNYQLHVQAAGPSNVWSHLATPLTIKVDAPPWATPWAWLAYVLATLLVVGWALLAWRRRLEQRHRLQLANQRRQMAETASHAKTRFLATLSHEIRTPMTGMLGMAELLQGAHLGGREHGYVDAIHSSGKQLLRLVNDALDIARIESGHFQLEIAPMQPRTLMEEIRGLLGGQLGTRPVTLQVAVHDAVPTWIMGDAFRIRQIVLNLGSNAIKFTERGTVDIDINYQGEQLQLTVSDTGPGISAADRERLFKRFEQADSPQRHSGSGLGLAICRELVASMHGRISLDSTPGKGSCFTVTLPLPATDAPAPSVATSTAGQPTVTLHLLLVEDNPTVAEVIRGLLEARGHSVVHTAQGLAALAELDRGHFDAILLDLDLPALDGYQLAGMIRQREADDAHVPIIAITARSGGDEQQRSLAAGMDAFLRKPLTGDELTTVLVDLTKQM